MNLGYLGFAKGQTMKDAPVEGKLIFLTLEDD